MDINGVKLFDLGQFRENQIKQLIDYIINLTECELLS
jgi:hypothetical protein